MKKNSAIPNDSDFNYFEEQQEYSFAQIFWEAIKVILISIIIIVPVRVFLVQPFFVKGASMEPNFKDKEYLIINEFGYKQTKVGLNLNGKQYTFFSVEPFRSLERGDVVVFRFPMDPKEYFIKRVIGLPGEKIEIKDSKIIIYNEENPKGFLLEENYLPFGEQTLKDQVVQLKSDEYFVLGDNRNHSYDSRDWGPLNRNYVIGRAILRAWPVSRFDLF